MVRVLLAVQVNNEYLFLFEDKKIKKVFVRWIIEDLFENIILQKHKFLVFSPN